MTESGDTSGSGGGLAGRRVLVIGASSGIGRSFAVQALAAGARVAVTARRAERLREVIDGAPNGIAVIGDVRDRLDCQRMVNEATSSLGQLYLIVYSAGAAPLRPLVDTTEEDWAVVFETHVLGVHHVVQAAIGQLAPGALIAILSSETVGEPRFGLGAYGASKAALEESVRAWRVEHPRQRFMVIAVGATFPTEFGAGFDPNLIVEALDHWSRHGLMTEELLDPDQVAGVLVGVFGTALQFPLVGLEHLVVRPPSPVVDRFGG
ncbi:MAG TPA: SDR family oxidoreductase [Acidimicrobiales bacterium]|nr:SDR family oxidoreductase [Acidimicrobiales bacterium]